MPSSAACSLPIVNLTPVCCVFRCRLSSDEYPILLRLPYASEYDTKLALLTDIYFNDALEKGWVEFKVAEDETVTFSVPDGASVLPSCRRSRTLRSPLQDPESGPLGPPLNESQRRVLHDGWWPARLVFELYTDVWCSWCRWALEHRISSEPPSPASNKRRRDAAAAVTSPSQ
jgi:hypothetical protein